jgi:hypothetical protein
MVPLSTALRPPTARCAAKASHHLEEGFVGRRLRVDFDKKLFGTGLALVAVGIIMAKWSRCNRFCRYLAKEIATTGSARFVKAFLA